MWDARAEADRWCRQAANDLAFARVAARERFYAQACFVAQQAAEKAVKAIAYALGERTVLGHSLVTLISRCADRVPELQDLRELAVSSTSTMWSLIDTTLPSSATRLPVPGASSREKAAT
ncbi:MAG: HEPN domain-containing protein [Acidobacteria bacterium]|nr:HEPN domain-containing protein [Acidobacteriota bacterium]MYH31188.1 HEPN domain-containing protein [Acidobacteriota bacterium]